MIKLNVSTNSSAADDRILRNGVLEFNQKIIGEIPSEYSVFAKNRGNEIIGGAKVYVHSQSIYIDILWVAEEHRQKSIGTKILSKVENEALKRNIPCSTVDTFDFQAEDFYLKNGYLRIGVIPKFIEGHDRIFLKKELPSN